MTLLDRLLPGFAHLQNIHPLVVHFPVAFLYGATLLYFLAWIVRRQSWAWTGLWMLCLGALGAAVAAYTGYEASGSVMLGQEVRLHLLDNHERLMFSTLGLSVVAAAWALWQRPLPRVWKGIPFLILLLIMIGVMTKGADYGGRMVYDYNAGGTIPGPIEWNSCQCEPK